jgi:alpha/beta superfamily hydrolase
MEAIQFAAQRPEHAGYFEVPGAHLYTVLHEVKDPLACVLLVGPFASQRHNSYLPWVRWARYLAGNNIEVLRYDYRGIGESTGDFDEMTFEDWSADVRLLSSWLEERAPHVPLFLHGLELGAILAGQVFDAGVGDGLLLWAAPVDANKALRSALMRWVTLEQIFKVPDERRTASDYIRELERGVPQEVEGYLWSTRLWQESFKFTLPAGLAAEERAAAEYQRPVRTVKLAKDAVPLANGGTPAHDEFKDFNWLFAPNCEWIIANISGADKKVTYASAN